jgi:Zn-dependent peptidase ImmA (M78 family)
VTRSIDVPITPSVLDWAIREAGVPEMEIAASVGVSLDELLLWRKGTGMPALTQFHKLASKLKRPEAFFFLARHPKVDHPDVRFRHPPNAARTAMNESERWHLREAARLQRAIAWMVGELQDQPPKLPQMALTTDTEVAGAEARQLLGVRVGDQLKWKGASAASAHWRTAFEGIGVLVFFLQLGKDASRGFSVWNESAPLIAANTWWNVEARIFTMFHEFGHLLTRTDSVCSQFGRPRLSINTDAAERWCEAFAAAALLPWDAVERVMRDDLGATKVTSMAALSLIARKFKASLRATAIRLINRSAASWDLYESIPPASDGKRPGGGGGEGRRRAQIRRDQYGDRPHGVLVRGLGRELVTRTDVLGLLDIPDDDLSVLEARARQ